ncbi:MAG: dTMP kinase [Alphaproteobacteria bacterium RIFCSPLOWO2_01_FULL_45_8]|nr:MAG: dTMP kinase [Alphaproteobacteria bacterium GWB1_45_5]OFW76663.1 MAG: dTMP kinase [Alphaproteobacteria bacterium GWA1_45_9]OFW89741.1 MAG: dTMP kinase [Alphaproteobacteria bacterium RIFCSPHIGHO2_01_FULL_41_14]OFW96225.1 MAG: dTMP kinase [Alphaproteobacteria bacterium RIFCSPLOWO2_01_FULL_45_8]
MTQKAKFITFEGGEGAGKTTQIQLLETALKNKGYHVIKTREPGGTTGAELLRAALKDHPETHWDAVSQVLILYAARRDLVEKVIKPALARNIWVLCDRFADSTFVYQGYAQNLGIEFVQSIHTATLKNFQPDLTFFFDLPPKEGLHRARKRSQQDFFESMTLDFHEKVYEGYKVLAHQNPRFFTVSGKLAPPHMTQVIFKALQEKFSLSL